MLKKIFFFLIGLVIILLVGLLFFGSSLLNKGVSTTINTLGPKVTQTQVSVEAVDLSLTRGGGKISGVKVGNPEGYKNENIFELGEIEVQVKPTSIVGDTIIVKKVHVNAPKISYEKTMKGSNLKDLQDNIKAFIAKIPGTASTTEASEEPKSDEEPSPKKIIIEDFQIKGGTVYAGLMGVGLEIPLPTIAFENIGAKDGPSFAEMGDQIIQEILNVIGPALKNSSEFISDGGKAALEGTKGAGKELMKLFGQ